MLVDIKYYFSRPELRSVFTEIQSSPVVYDFRNSQAFSFFLSFLIIVVSLDVSMYAVDELDCIDPSVPG